MVFKTTGGDKVHKSAQTMNALFSLKVEKAISSVRFLISIFPDQPMILSVLKICWTILETLKIIILIFYIIFYICGHFQFHFLIIYIRFSNHFCYLWSLLFTSFFICEAKSKMWPFINFSLAIVTFFGCIYTKENDDPKGSLHLLSSAHLLDF